MCVCTGIDDETAYKSVLGDLVAIVDETEVRIDYQSSYSVGLAWLHCYIQQQTGAVMLVDTLVKCNSHPM